MIPGELTSEKVVGYECPHCTVVTSFHQELWDHVKEAHGDPFGKAYIVKLSGGGTRLQRFMAYSYSKVLKECPPKESRGKEINPGGEVFFHLPKKFKYKEDREGIPLCTGVLDYFPDALKEIARVSLAGNNQHNPGEPLHWDRSKSTDHVNKILRHMVDRGKLDTDGTRHSAKVAWRALAMLQEEIEKESK